MVTPSHAADRFAHPGMTDAVVLEGQFLQDTGIHDAGFVTSSTDSVHAAVEQVTGVLEVESEDA